MVKNAKNGRIPVDFVVKDQMWFEITAKEKPV